MSHRSGETEDTFIADLVVGLCCGQVGFVDKNGIKKEIKIERKRNCRKKEKFVKRKRKVCRKKEKNL